MRQLKSHHTTATICGAQKQGLARIIGESAAIREAVRILKCYSRCEYFVLITGESGSGKEVFARALHEESARADGPFVTFNCGLYSPELITNELFGHESGAFSGAGAASAGLIEQADGGTFFLNEINSLPREAQPKLLCYMDDRNFRRLGAGPLRRSNARIVCATNQDLSELVRAGSFRSDLYYRLSVLTLRLPPLRERREDIPALAEFLLARHEQANGGRVSRFSEEAIRVLMEYDWPGNVRELSNVILRATALAASEEIGVSDLAIGVAASKKASEPFKEQKAKLIAAWEWQTLAEMLALTRGNLSRAARATGMHRRAFFGLVRKHQLHAKGASQFQTISGGLDF